MLQHPQSPLSPARRTVPQHPLEPGAQDRDKERKKRGEISEHVGNMNKYKVWILCAGCTWMTGTPRSFRSWRQSLVWDDAACSTKEDTHCMSGIHLKTNETCFGLSFTFSLWLYLFQSSWEYANLLPQLVS